MPMVTAANLPYNGVPSTSPAPTPGNDYQSIRGATPEAFGAGIGEATSRLGSQFEQAGRGLEAAAIEQQQLVNRVAADNATNYVMDNASKLLHGDPDKPGDVGYYGLKGNDALQARKPTWDNINNVIDSARAKLTNPRQLLEFDNETRRMRNYWQGEIGRHYDQQLNQAAHNAAVAQGQLAAQGASSAAANLDQQGFSHFVENWMTAEIKKVQAAGGGDDEKNAALGNVRASATRIWADSVGMKDPVGALKFLEENKDALKPGEYPAIVKEFRAKAAAAQARDDAYGGNLVRGGAVQGRIGPLALDAIDEFKKAGWTEAAINGALANGQAEGGFDTAWKAGDKGTSFGHWQLHKGGEYEGFFQFGNGAADTRTQAKYIVQRMEQIHPGFGKITDPKLATDIMEREFEQPDPKRQPYGNRYAGPLLGGTQQAVAPAEPADSVTTTPTGVKATPAAAADTLIGSTVPHEPGELPDASVPGLVDKLKDIDARIPKDAPGRAERIEAAVKLVRRDMNAAYADQQHAIKLEQEKRKAQDEALMTQYQRRMATTDKFPTTSEVLADQRLSPEAQRTLVGFIERQNKQDPSAEISKRTTHDLYEKMTLPDDDTNKLRDMNAVHRAYNDQQLTRQDHDWLVAQNEKLQKVGDESFKAFRDRKLRSVSNQVLGNSAFLPANERQPEDIARQQAYIDAVDDKIEEYRKANKNPRDLFDPKKPDNVVSPEFLKEFMPSIAQATKPAASAVDLSTPPKVEQALRAQRITYEQAVKALEAMGVPHAQAAPAVAAPLR